MDNIIDKPTIVLYTILENPKDENSQKVYSLELNGPRELRSAMLSKIFCWLNKGEFGKVLSVSIYGYDPPYFRNRLHRSLQKTSITVNFLRYGIDIRKREDDEDD